MERVGGAQTPVFLESTIYDLSLIPWLLLLGEYITDTANHFCLLLIPSCGRCPFYFPRNSSLKLQHGLVTQSQLFRQWVST